jgi:glycosyltransferase involved in cell wall biosynthesis
METALRIAVDARPLSIPLTGIVRYTEELLCRLLATRHQWFLYSDRPLLSQLAIPDNVQIRTGHCRHRVMATLYPQWAYPRWAAQDHIDVFWSPRHHLPLALPDSVRTVVTLHDLVGFLAPETMTTMGRRLETWLTPRSIRKADAIIVDAASTLDDLDSVLGYGADKASVIPLAATAAPGLADLPRPLAEDYFLFVGTLEPRKNLMRLLQAFSVQAPNMPGVQLVLAGAVGWGNQDLEQTLQQLGIAKQVTLTGRLDEARLHSFYRYALALVLPSLYEGFGLPLVEAMQYGVPVITSNCSSMPEVAGEGGLLVDPRDVDSIGAAMLKLASDPLERQRLSAVASAQAACFCWDEAAKKTLAVLENC